MTIDPVVAEAYQEEPVRMIMRKEDNKYYYCVYDSLVTYVEGRCRRRSKALDKIEEGIILAQEARDRIVGTVGTALPWQAASLEES